MSRVKNGEEQSDALATAARGLFMLGILSLPWLTLRVSSFTISDVLLGTSLLLTLLSPARRDGPPAYSGLVVLAGWIGLLGALGSEYFDPQWRGGLATIARLAFVWVVWTWQARRLLTTEARVSRALRFYAAGAAVSALAAVGQYRFGLVIPGSELTSTFRAPGLAQHPNDQGGALALALVMAFAALTARETKAKFWLAVAVSTTAGLMVAGSVTGMLVSVLGALAVVVLRQLSFRTILTAGVVAGLAILIGLNTLEATGTGAASGMGPLERLTVATGGGTSQQDTTKDRIDTMRVAAERIDDNILIGRGFSSEQTVAVGDTQVHNMLLGVWMAGGILVLIAVLLLWAGAWRAVRSAPVSLVRHQIAAALVTAFAFSMTAPIMFQRYAWLPVTMAFALAAVRKEQPRWAENDPVASRVVR